MMKFELNGGLILAPAAIRYKQTKIDITCLVDTGSAGTAVDIDLIELDYSRPSRIVEIAGIGGTQEVVIQKTENLQFCGRAVENFPVQFGEIASNFGFGAIVGSDLLNALGICIDYYNKELRVPGDNKEEK